MNPDWTIWDHSQELPQHQHLHHHYFIWPLINLYFAYTSYIPKMSPIQHWPVITLVFEKLLSILRYALAQKQNIKARRVFFLRLCRRHLALLGGKEYRFATWTRHLYNAFQFVLNIYGHTDAHIYEEPSKRCLCKCAIKLWYIITSGSTMLGEQNARLLLKTSFSFPTLIPPHSPSLSLFQKHSHSLFLSKDSSNTEKYSHNDIESKEKRLQQRNLENH